MSRAGSGASDERRTLAVPNELVRAEGRAFAALGGRPLLDGQTVVLTGATGGIGRTLARMLATAGARLAVTDLSPASVETLASELGCYGEPVDASSWPAFAAFRRRVEAELGPLDGLVNCAGLWRPLPYDEIDERAWAETLSANLGTAFATCRAVLPGMVARGTGSVVNFASTAGEYGSIRPAAHYAAAKGGVIALTKSLAREVSPRGVRVNAISPGPTDTPALGAATPEQRAAAGARTLFGRLGEPHEIGGACVFLLSPLSTFVTGQVLGVNGGSLL
jgi:NAD(P)-dependent dehydrogenase (short-subunit alcohol dehydrogenase family)